MHSTCALNSNSCRRYENSEFHRPNIIKHYLATHQKKVRIDDVMDDVIRATHDLDSDVEEINKRSNTSTRWTFPPQPSENEAFKAFERHKEARMSGETTAEECEWPFPTEAAACVVY